MKTKTKKCEFYFDGIQFSFEVDENEVIISDKVKKTGVWEKHQLSLYAQLIPETGVMVDIGANVGVNSIFAKKRIPSARIICVEALQSNFELLQRNCHGIDVDLHPIVIADHNGCIGFSGSDTNARISKHGQQVPCKTLDSFTSNIKHINLLKIDVEGFTDMVLAESSETLAKTDKAIIEFSLHDVKSRGIVDPNGHFDDLFRMVGFDYAYYISKNDGLVQISEASDLIALLEIESRVGDVLFSRTNELSISCVGFALRKVKSLMTQNHRRMIEIRDIKNSV